MLPLVNNRVYIRCYSTPVQTDGIYFDEFINEFPGPFSSQTLRIVSPKYIAIYDLATLCSLLINFGMCFVLNVDVFRSDICSYLLVDRSDNPESASSLLDQVSGSLWIA
jgi:hypothetical protein